MSERWSWPCRSGFSPTIMASLFLLVLALPSYAHEVRPAYLEIIEQPDNIYSLTWKQPSLAEARIAIDPQLPATCTPLGERHGEVADGAFVARWQARCPGGLAGQKIRIVGLERTLTCMSAVFPIRALKTGSSTLRRCLVQFPPE